MPTYVIGHKNPDTDAICSAIAYADLLRRTSMPEAEAACCGELSSRTLFVLEKAGLPIPRLVLDVRPTAGQICRRDVIAAHEGDSYLAAFDGMRERGLRSMPVVDSEGRIAGMLSLFMIVDTLLPAKGPTGDERHGTRRITSSLEQIRTSLAGSFQHANGTINGEEELVLAVAAYSSKEFTARLKSHDTKKLLVVMGDRPSVQRSAIEHGVRGIVITGGNSLSEEFLALARKQNVAVLLSPTDTATTTLLIKCSEPISRASSPDFLSFPEHTTVDQIHQKLTEVEPGAQTLFPVLAEDRTMIGVFSVSDLIDPPRTKLILVDHNEWNQAVHGAQEAEILEVLDHHRLGGGLASKHPIRFINEPVGSTCTLVSRLFRQSGLDPEPQIALAMAAGIISDTLFLTSPTTTDLDRKTLAWLGDVAKTDLKAFADAFFAAGSVLVNTPAPQAIRTDCKHYDECGWKIAASQIEEQSLDNFWKQKEPLTEALEAYRQEHVLDFACLLVTDITRHNSVLLVAGRPEIIRKIDYPKLENNLFEMEGIVSRKKQLMPLLTLTLQKARKG